MEEKRKKKFSGFTFRFGDIPFGMLFSFMGQTRLSTSIERVRR
jgi:hypothetical protein